VYRDSVGCLSCPGEQSIAYGPGEYLLSFEALPQLLLYGTLEGVTVPLYLASSPEPVVAWTLRLFPPERRPRAREVLLELRRGLLDWLKGRLLAMVFVAVLWTLVLYVIGIPGALFLGILAGGSGSCPT
jgi:predicted PurR-regulated permease PerM